MLEYKDIKIGSRYSLSRSISQMDVENFAALSGDFNPLHLDEKYAGSTMFGGTIVHGMLAASLFSTLIGMLCPGRNAVILRQEIRYLSPVRPGSIVRATGKVIRKVDALKIIVMEHAVKSKSGKVLIEGVSNIKVMR